MTTPLPRTAEEAGCWRSSWCRRGDESEPPVLAGAPRRRLPKGSQPAPKVTKGNWRPSWQDTSCRRFPRAAGRDRTVAESRNAGNWDSGRREETDVKHILQDGQPATGRQDPGEGRPASDEYWSPKANRRLKVISSGTESVSLLIPKPKVCLALVFHLKFGPYHSQSCRQSRREIQTGWQWSR